ncbi:MAG: ATP-binding protein, partial [Bacteroidota bacterium]
MKNTLYLLLPFFVFACGETTPPEQTTETTPPPPAMKPNLEMAWETDTLLTTVESVLYDAAGGRYFAANVANNPWEMDGEGFISVVGKDGTILNAELSREGLNGPKGMGLHNGKL